MTFNQRSAYPESWEILPLSSCTKRITYGFTNPMPDSNDGPWKITAKNIKEGRIDYRTARRTTLEAFQSKLTDKSRVQLGDLLLTKDGTLGRIAICDNPDMCISQSVAVIRPNETVLVRFLKFLLESKRFQRLMIGEADGTTIKHIYISRVAKMEIPLPPLVEQKAIAHILGTLDDKIELNRRMNETLEEMARTLFKSWFVDFDPVRAKLDGRQPVGMDAETAALFPAEFQDSELGKIPKGWEVKSVGEVVERITKGDTPRKSAIAACDENGEYVNLVKVNCISPIGEVIKEKLSKIPMEIHLGKSKRSILSVNDILYTNAGTIGRVVLVDSSFLPSNTNQAVAILKTSERFPAIWLYCCLREQEFQARMHQDIVQAVQANLALGKIASARFCVPSISVLHKLTNPLNKLICTIKQNCRANESLASLRDTLLPKLLSGELRIKDAEKFMENAL